MPDFFELDAISTLQKRLVDAAELHLADETTIRQLQRMIEALREALASILSVERTTEDDGLITAEWHLACCNARAALALVTGGPDA